MQGLEELTAYLRGLPVSELIIVDGSEPKIFRKHAASWFGIAQHVPPDPAIPGLNGKVRGVLTGVAIATREKIIIADDDVRYCEQGLAAMSQALDDVDVVRPQNYFRPHAWHTMLDTGRTLINRVFGGDWPGTLGIRRAALREGYSADVLFENLELVRTIKALGGREKVASDIFIARRPPSTRHFFSQRVRQAYDEFARPFRLGLWLALLPLIVTAAFRAPRALPVCWIVVVLTAESGRQRHGGKKYFPLSASLAAPLWVMERAICAWLAVLVRLQYGGMPYSGKVIRVAATPSKRLRDKVA